MNLTDIISIIYFIASVIYFFYGLMIISYNLKSQMHWLFFCCCLAMSLWSVIFSIENVAVDYEGALIWRRIASVGWGSMFSFLLHYILLLTEKKILKKKWIYILLYTPALLNIFLYGIYTKTAVKSYNLVKTSFGWVNIPGNTALDWYYNVYYIGFVVIGIILLLHWGYTSKDITKRKQAFIISGSYLVAVIIGSFTEYVINYFSNAKVPQLAPIITLITLTSMLFCILKYNFMRHDSSSREPEANQILSEYTKTKLYTYMYITYLIAGFVNFGMQFFSKRENLFDIIFFSSTIFGLGLVLGIIQNLKIKQEYKEQFSNVAFIFSIPVIILKYTNVSGVYAWAVPVILMLVAIALNQRHMLYLIAVITFTTLIWLWYKVPVLNITFSTVDHIARLIILTIILRFVIYINRTYVDNINTNKERVRFQEFLNQVSNIFLTTNEANYNEKIAEAIELCANKFNLECFHLWLISTSKDSYNGYQWYASGTEITERLRVKGKLEEFIRDLYPEMLSADGSLFISETKVSKENKPVDKLLESIGVKSLIIRPMREKNEEIGILCLGSNDRIVTWGEQQQQTANLIVHMLTDIWMRLAAERELYYQANYDVLTKLPNRINFFKHLNNEINKAQYSNKYVGVMFIDLDGFKVVNDSLGHESGDDILVQIGKIIQDSIRPIDFLARFGGDEFLIMVPEIDAVDDIQSVAERLTESFQKSLTVKNQEFYLTVSTGIAVYPYDGRDPETLIKNADLAMYKSKEYGKNQYTFCTDDMKEEVILKIRLVEDLFKALERQEFKLYYQPQVCAVSKKIIGIEALIRWFHPEFGIVSPGLFIPLAEQNGLIGPIGDWVLMTACLQCRAYHLKGLDVRISVNVSIIQLQSPKFALRVKQILEETQLEPHYLELEITESVAVRESDYFIEVLNSLKELGISISIDDFGTEYSSLSRLCIMPIDRIKIDIQFVHGIGQSEKENSIISGIIDLAHNLGLMVIAEGVETKIQYDFLTENNIDEIQGFYFYRPIPQDELEQLLLHETNS